MFLVWWIQDRIGIEFKNMDKIFTALWVLVIFLAFVTISFTLSVMLDRLVWCGLGMMSIYGCNY